MRRSLIVFMAIVASALLILGVVIARWLFVDDRPNLTERSVAGTWVSADDQAELVLQADGTFTARGVPHIYLPDIFEDSRDASWRHSGSGHWELSRPIGDESDVYTQVFLGFDSLTDFPAGKTGISVTGVMRNGALQLCLETESASYCFSRDTESS